MFADEYRKDHAPHEKVEPCPKCKARRSEVRRWCVCGMCASCHLTYLCTGQKRKLEELRP